MPQMMTLLNFQGYKGGRKTREIFNVSNILSAAVIVLMIGIIATAASEMYITSGVLLIVLAVCACLSIKEDG